MMIFVVDYGRSGRKGYSDIRGGDGQGQDAVLEDDFGLEQQAWNHTLEKMAFFSETSSAKSIESSRIAPLYGLLLECMEGPF
ncbi:hypothetical protein Y032_0083g1669 [Ancylostoma ceylanicum]|uniref:Uncharacterized protein n=1 Tax=Ancylostoma ceylanicum TaxID=53326 RepID=A0A016TS65_9BILA|nr:hypothetical protein Y032_0083g1669 [Ancylostoma ceylanicum]